MQNVPTYISEAYNNMSQSQLKQAILAMPSDPHADPEDYYHLVDFYEQKFGPLFTEPATPQGPEDPDYTHELPF